ncbi:hypothetical protein ABEB36_011949 [Hypothenemus hampei]|uniref:DNA endonuclease RBBP8 n=1 Tax=Hypothenemus hampei TaxID=57062 RepID=A0ABD1E9R9_HYPHA
MNSSNAFEQWQQLFDDKASKVWQEEPLSLLKNLSMIIYCVNKEMKHIQDVLQNKYIDFRSLIDKKHFKINTSVNLTKIETPSISQSTSKAFFQSEKSPNLSSAKSLNNIDSFSNLVIISDDDFSKSPKIKTKHRMTNRFLQNRKLIKENAPIEPYHKTSSNFKNKVTLQKLDSDLDCSVVQCTPVKSSMRSWKKHKPPSVKKQSEKQNSPKTRVQTEKSQHHKSDQSSMGITKMLHYINQVNKTIEESEEDDDCTPTLFLNESNDSALNSGMIEDNANITNLNNFLAKAQKISDQQTPEPGVVRGKLRQALPGWSCKECEDFYLKQGLNADEILALNKCTRHRGRYMPREDTVPGFWDMDMS